MADLLNTTMVVLTHVLETKSLPDASLLKLLITQALGYAILAGACVTKLPQILVIWKAGTAQGLITEMFEVETYALLVSSLYGYTQQLPFNTYGESVILAVQNAVILALVYSYSRAPMIRRLSVTAAYAALVAAVMTGRVSGQAMNTFAEVNTGVVMAARLPQVVKNFAARSTGALSGITAGINVLGCVVRLFTTVQAGGGDTMLRSYIVSLIINATMLLQIIAYRKNTAAVLKAQREKAVAEEEKRAGVEGKKDK